MPVIAEKSYCFEGYTLDLWRGCVRHADDEIGLRPKSFEVLRYLVENASRLVSKDELIRAIWPNVIVADESLTRCVSDVRQALGDVDQRIIKTVPRRGYVFEAPVFPRNDLDGRPSANGRQIDDGRRMSILVLPFASLSGNREDEYFADGITDDLISDLSQWENSFVIGRSTAFTFKGRAVDAKSIGRDLDVRYMLNGSVRRAGDRMRIGVQVANTETGGNLWADRFDRRVADMLEMQDEIVGHIAATLHHKMTDPEGRRARRAR
jgi:TolB-like protein